jgi:hypothetical protein
MPGWWDAGNRGLPPPIIKAAHLPQLFMSGCHIAAVRRGDRVLIISVIHVNIRT